MVFGIFPSGSKGSTAVIMENWDIGVVGRLTKLDACENEIFP